jgi:integrase
MDCNSAGAPNDRAGLVFQCLARSGYSQLIARAFSMLDHKLATKLPARAFRAGKASQRRRRFEANAVANLPVGDHTDPSLQGLQLRVRAKGAGCSRTWLFRTRYKGKWLRVTLGHLPAMSLADARDEVRKLQRFADLGIDPSTALPKKRHTLPAVPASVAVAVKAGPHSIETLCSEFMDRFIRPARKRPEVVQYMLDRNVLPAWRGRDARTITPHEVIALLDGIVDRGSRVQANRVASLLGQLFKFGIHRRIVAATPVQLLYKPGGKEKARSRVLSDAELTTFLCNPQDCTRFEKLSHVMLVLLLTGQRRGELSLARWDDVDLVRKQWTIPEEHSKTGRAHLVPLSDWAVQEFNALHRERGGSPFVLPGADGQAHDAKLLTRATARCQKRFQERGIAHFTLHDLRRTCRTGLSKLKVQPHIAERVLNHVQAGMSAVYDLHDYVAEKRDALDKWAAHLTALRSADGTAA